jgi:hypothetical protein
MQIVPGTSGSLRWIFDGQFLFSKGAIILSAARTYTDGVTTSGSPVFTSASANFTSSLVGRSLTGWSVPPGTTILNRLSATQVTMSANATGSGTGIYGHVSGADRIIWHRTQHQFAIDEWRRQFDEIVSVKGLVAPPGGQIPQDEPNAGGSGYYHDGVWFDARFKGNFSPTGFRLEGATRMYQIGCDIGPFGDDAVFTGDSSDYVYTIGCNHHDIRNNVAADGSGAYQGAGPDAWLHNDCWQGTGSHTNRKLWDSTLQGHGLEIVAEGGHIKNTSVDRCWQGMAGADGGDIGVTSYTLDNTNLIGSGAPTTRLTGHYYKGFSNGTDHNDGDAQQGYAVSGGGAGWHAVLVSYGGHSASVSVTVAVPTGATVDSHGFITSGKASFTGSVDAPYQRFVAAYAADELFTVLSDYGITLD